ncbi:MAG: hypothetical protein ACOYM7_03865, partial [Paludibacter sp.]
MIKFKIAITSVLLMLITISCTNNKRFGLKNSEPENTLQLIRFDSLILHADTSVLNSEIHLLYTEYPEFMPYFAEQIMGVNPNDTVAVVRLIKAFRSNKAFEKVNADVQKTFQKIDTIKWDIETAYQYLHQYFPEIKTPPVYFFVSGFNRSIILEDKFVGVGLDLYLGANYPKYAEISYQYMVYNMRPASIAPDVISGILFKHFQFDAQQNRLLENMLYRGKVLYLLSVIMPNLKPNDIIGYSRFQWEWSRKYEDKIWNSIVGQKDLYSSDQLLINKYMNDAPFTATISQESPGRLGAWVGWQIIQTYMEENTDVSIQQLMK